MSLLPGSVCNLGNDRLEVLARIVKAKIERNRIKDVTKVPWVSQKADRSSGAKPELFLYPIKDDLLHRDCGITDVVRSPEADDVGFLK